MLGLAIDSAGRTSSSAIWRSSHDDTNGIDGDSIDDIVLNFDLIDQDALPPETGKADQLIVVIDGLLRRHGLDVTDLDVLAVNRGPGSFTGIRSAVALARGLALATGLPVLGVSGHEALAAMIGDRQAGRPLLVAQDARRGELYVQAFDRDGKPRSGIDAMAPALAAATLEAGRWCLAGDGGALVGEQLTDAADVQLIALPPLDAVAIARVAATRLAGGEAPGMGFDLSPLYVRAPDAVPPAPLISSTGGVEVVA